MLTGIKLSKVQLSKIIQSVRVFGALLDKLVGPLIKVSVPLAEDVLAQLATMASVSAIDGAIKDT